MPRIATPLNDTQLRQAKPKDKEYNLADGGGLMLRVKPSGTKLWIFNYSRPYTKKRANISFGPYPSLTLTKARKRRDDAKELLAQNIDPKGHRDEAAKAERQQHAQILEEVAQRWLEVKRSKVSDDYAGDIWRSLELHILPSLGKLPIHKINAPDTIDVIRPIAAKGSLETVDRKGNQEAMDKILSN